MLTTALRPRSLLLLVLALGVATAFVLLSQWQLESGRQARTVADPAKDVARPLVDAARAGEPVTTAQADQLVTATGTYREASTVLVPGRLRGGTEGWWAVTALTLPGTAQEWDDAGGDLTVAVARGWTEDPAAVPDEPAGAVDVVGRYLPPEAPVPGGDLPDGQVGSVSPAQLTNRWDVPVYPGFVAAAAESPAGQAPRPDDAGRPDAVLLSPELSPLEIDQQPTDESVDLLNLFYAVEWVVFAGFALYVWWRFVRDAHLRAQRPEEYFYLDGDYFHDEASGRYYYYDPAAGEYYWFDDQPRAATQDRTGAHHD